MTRTSDSFPIPSPERLMSEHHQLLADGFHKLLTAQPDPETGKLDARSVDQLIADQEQVLGEGNVAVVEAAFDADGYIRSTDGVETIYVRDGTV